ncbi:MAG: HipA N-terminal domain-containing protein [Bacteroidales bacterium]|nr:HipA N-terminal domain-containing protein [Bacteroidales bacterium]
MIKALVYFRDVLAGRLAETDDGYEFQYEAAYLAWPQAEPISLTLPLRKEVYQSNVLFPFFDGLIPEGWLLDVALRNTDISILDRMSLLLLCCKDCIGAVSVIPVNEEDSYV